SCGFLLLTSFSVQAHSEIIGGQEAKPHSRPYMAYLDIQSGVNRSFCGGFLVSENFVLTAAHCNGDKIIVKLGAHNIKQREWSQQKISVRRRIPHPQYDKETFNNDIMLLQLAKSAKLNRWVKTITLPFAKNSVKPGTMCSIAGWGRTSTETKSTPDTLQEVNLKVLEDDVCMNNLDVTYNDYDASTMMCGGDLKKGKTSFKGDSGGPLVCGKTAQGIVSWGSEDGRPPAVYTRVSTFIPWIRVTMRRLQP
uniref:Peptidase S1 domain-containing protein n=1 Tax=Chelonoidis abingdonii TaxID=106734 RepID=A0A8C0GV86_CHEAB